MREEDSNWFSKWEEQLLPPEELTPLSETLISRDLALAFDIHPTTNDLNSSHFHHRPIHHHIHHRSSAAAPPDPTHPPSSGDFDSSSAELGGGDGPARTLKRPRLVWTPQLHKRFVDAVAHLGIKNAVPKTIMQLMSVDGLTRENVASHLQKYRLYLKRMQGINSGGGGGGGSGDSATDHLFASSPVPAHFLHPQSGGGGGGGRSNAAHSEHFLGYVPPPATVAALHQQQVAAMVTDGQYHHHHHRQAGHFGSPTSGGGGGGHPFLSRQSQMGGARLGVSNGGGGVVRNSVSGYGEDLDSGTAASGRKVLSLFPSD